MSNSPNPPHGWRLVDKAKDCRKDHPIIISFGEAEGWLSVANSSYDCWNSSIEYAVPIKEPPKPPTINDIPWITDRLPTKEDAAGDCVLAIGSLYGKPLTLHVSCVELGTPWKPLAPCDPPPKRQPLEFSVIVDADGRPVSVHTYLGNTIPLNFREIKVREVMEDDQ